MALIMKKMRGKIVSPDCFKAKKPCSPVSKVNIPKQISPPIQRLSLSDVSNPSFPISPQDLSNSLLGSNLHIFSLEELALMTNNFSRKELLGEGGFGKVYRGFIDDSLKPGLEAQPVAVKVLDLKGSQGQKEWLAEIILLGQLKHPHLVTLIGYCYEYEHRLLVYEYMPLGNLENKLFENGSATLPWLTRIKIAIGTAQCLAFLHEGVKKSVIYRDLKSSNILLDKDYIAKLSDFGLAKDGPEGDDTYILTRIMGTYGYAAPEYMMTGQLTTMCDVYSFGVVLLELLTGRRSIDKYRPRREQCLINWAWPFLKNLNIEQIMDPRLEGQYSNKGIKKAAELAYKCLNRDPKSRPTMSTVVKALEPVLDFSDIPRGHFLCTVSSQPQHRLCL